jgi:hypothetical protein
MVYSTTMWIHLNGGDEALKAFLRLVCNPLRGVTRHATPPPHRQEPSTLSAPLQRPSVSSVSQPSRYRHHWTPLTTRGTTPADPLGFTAGVVVPGARAVPGRCCWSRSTGTITGVPGGGCGGSTCPSHRSSGECAISCWCVGALCRSFSVILPRPGGGCSYRDQSAAPRGASVRRFRLPWHPLLALVVSR